MDIPQVTPKANAETGEMGQMYLATGKQVVLRRWEEVACEFGEPRCCEYETFGKQPACSYDSSINQNQNIE